MPRHAYIITDGLDFLHTEHISIGTGMLISSLRTVQAIIGGIGPESRDAMLIKARKMSVSIYDVSCPGTVFEAYLTTDSLDLHMEQHIHEFV